LSTDQPRPSTRPGTPGAAAGIAILAAAAPLALAGVTVVMLAAAGVGRHPLWREEVLNMAEAAAARDISTVAALLDRGEDPNRPRPIRPPLLDGSDRAMTPLEAGVRARRLEVVHLLLSRGAVPDPATRAALICDAMDNGDADIAAALAGGAPPAACSR
jgi:hypothetical protein